MYLKNLLFYFTGLVLNKKKVIPQIGYLAANQIYEGDIKRNFLIGSYTAFVFVTYLQKILKEAILLWILLFTGM